MGYFNNSEFKCCECGLGKQNMSVTLLTLLEKIREDADIPFIVNSSIRCHKNNKKVGGTKNSSHLKGYAIDIQCLNSLYRYKILKAAFKHEIKRIGVYKTFIHLDVDPDKPKEVLWRD